MALVFLMVGRRGAAAGGAGATNFLSLLERVYNFFGNNRSVLNRVCARSCLPYPMRWSPRLRIVIAIETPRIFDVQ